MMNKVPIIYALAAVVVAAYALPAQKSFAGSLLPQAINWTDVASKVSEIETVVKNGVQEIKTVANNDNEQVGSTIGSKVDATATTLLRILEQVNAAIQSETLTEDQARDQISTLKGNIARLIGSLQGDLALLTPEASDQILAIFKATFDGIELLAEELFVLLGGIPSPTTTEPTSAVPSSSAP